MRFARSIATANVAVLAAAVLVAAAGSAAVVTASPDASPSPSAEAVAAAPAPQLPSTAPAAPVAPPAAAPPAVPVATRPPAVRPRVVPTPAVRATPEAVAPARRLVTQTRWRPYATVGPVTLHFPGEVVEVVGLHQSGHDGALPQSPVRGGSARVGLLESRERGTHPQGAADIVVDPTRQVRSPVTGVVRRAGDYALYCDEVDHFLVVEPDSRPGWEVKLVHFEGLRVRPGDRVQAGVTVVGSRARVLPFRSQVDKHTVAPSWPHVHVEVVDPSIKDRSSGRGCN